MHMRAVLLGAAACISVLFSWGLLCAYVCHTLGGCCVHMRAVLLGAAACMCALYSWGLGYAITHWTSLPLQWMVVAVMASYCLVPEQ